MYFTNCSYTSVEVYPIIICVNVPDWFLHNSWKSLLSSVEREFWSRVQQPLCFISPGMFTYLASIKHCEALNHALSNSQCLQSKTKSICFLHGCQGNRRQELHLTVPRKAELWTDLLNIYKNHVRAQLHPGEILSQLLSTFTFPSFQHLFLKHLLLTFQSLLTTLTPVHFPSPNNIFRSSLVWSKSCGFSYFPAVQCFSCYLPLDCVFKRTQVRYFSLRNWEKERQWTGWNSKQEREFQQPRK